MGVACPRAPGPTIRRRRGRAAGLRSARPPSNLSSRDPPRRAEHVLAVLAPCERSGTKHARFRAERSLLYPYQIARRRPGPEVYFLAGWSQDELPRLGGAASDGYDLRIENVDEPGQADTQPPSRLFEDRDGSLVALTGEPAHVLPEHLSFDGEPSQGGVRFFVGDLPRPAPDGRARGEGLEATVVAATAAWTGRVERHVPQFPARTLGAPQEDSVGDDATANPGAKCYEHLVIAVLAGPVAKLAPCRSVGVVLDGDPETRSPSYHLVQSDVLYSVQVGREHYLVFCGQDQSRNGHANAADLEAGPHLVDRSGDGVHQPVRRDRQGRVPDLVQDLAVRRDDRSGDLGSPNVHSYGVHALRLPVNGRVCPVNARTSPGGPR